MLQLFLFLLSFFLLPCNTHEKESTVTGPEKILFDPLLADGFAYPFGDGEGGGKYTAPDGRSFNGWYIATHTGEVYALGVHTGEDWNGNGGGNTDLGQPVYATAKGKVLAARDYGAPWGNVVLVEHRYLENAKVKTIFSLYAHLDQIHTQVNDTLQKRQQLGTVGTGGGAYPAHLHFELRNESMREHEVTYWPSNHGQDSKWVLDHYAAPSAFIDAHRDLLVPAKEKELLVVVKSSYSLYHYRQGVLTETLPVALSQNPTGHKQQQGDNRLPEGHYQIIQKARGPFTGSYAAYFGPAWIRINYPNAFDAREGLKNKKITAAQCAAIEKAIAGKKEPPKNTALGGGIGIHGWAGEWPQDNRHLTWGCVSLRNEDLDVFYDKVVLQTPLLILP